MVGIEGFAIVSYCVDKDGLTTCINVIEPRPVGVFESAEEAAVMQFRYLLAADNGLSTERHGVSYEFDFEL